MKKKIISNKVEASQIKKNTEWIFKNVCNVSPSFVESQFVRKSFITAFEHNFC